MVTNLQMCLERRRSLLGIVLILAITLIIPPETAVAQESSSTKVVEQFQDTLIAVMKDAESLGYEGRYARLAPAVRQSHDLPLIARVAIGRYWSQLDQEQKALLVDRFSELSIATYASRFDSYSGQTFEALSDERVGDDEAVVHTQLIEPDGNTRRFDYLLRRTAEGWRIVNIIVDGVSDLALKRAEYTSIVRREGFDSLIAKLEEKITQYSQPKGSS